MKKYVYEVHVIEKSKAIIPILASDGDEARKMFDEWRDDHEGDLEDMLENGYEGYEIYVGAPRNAEIYPLDNILLPLELKKQPDPYPDDYALIIWDEIFDTVSIDHHQTYADVCKRLAALSDEYEIKPYIFGGGPQSKKVDEVVDNIRNNDPKQSYWVIRKRLRDIRDIKTYKQEAKQERSYISYELDCNKNRVARPKD